MTITKMEQTNRRLEAERFLEMNNYSETELLNVLSLHFALDCDDGKKIIPFIPIKVKTNDDGTVGATYGAKSNLTEIQMQELKLKKKVDLIDGHGYPFTYKEFPVADSSHFEIRLNFGKPKMIIDIDGLVESGDIKLKDYFDLPIPQQLKDAPFFLSRTKSLPHHLFYIEDIPEDVTKNMYCNVFKSFNGDILLNHVWELKDAKMYNYNGELPTISWNAVKYWLDPKKKNAKEIAPKTILVDLCKTILKKSSPQLLLNLEDEKNEIEIQNVTPKKSRGRPKKIIVELNDEKEIPTVEEKNDEIQFEIENIDNSEIVIGEKDKYNDEIKFYIENQGFNFGTGTHLEWITFGGYLRCLCNDYNAYKLWALLTEKCGTSNKLKEYASTWKHVKSLINDTFKTIQKIRFLVGKDKPLLRENWKKQEKLNALQLKEIQKNQNKEKKEASKQASKEEKEAFKEKKEAFKEEKKMSKERQKQSQQEKEFEEQEERRMNNTFVKTDDEAINVIFERFQNNLIYTNGTIFLKRLDQNIWINDDAMLNAYMITYILGSQLYKTNDTYKLIPYSAFLPAAKKICEGVLYKVTITMNDNTQYDKFHSSTKNIICFQDGILDFELKTFTKWENIPKEKEIFTTVIIGRDFEHYFNNPNREYVDVIVKELFTGMFGDETEKVLNFFARAISGNFQDKNFLSFRGNRNCGKGVLYDLFKSSFEKYVGTFALNNIVCQRETKKSSDEAKENAWLLPLEFQRISISQETPDNENNSIKQGLKLDNKALKTIMSGGDTIIGRRMFKDAVAFTIESTLCFFGNETLSVNGDANKHHYITSGVKQYVTQEEYDSKQLLYGDAYMTSYGVRNDGLKNLVKSSDDYKNALVILLLENWKNTPITISEANIYGEANVNESIRELIFKNYEITHDTKDRISKDEVVTVIGKDKKKIIDELRQLECVDPKDKCRMTVEYNDIDDKGKKVVLKKQVQAFYKIKRRVAVDDNSKEVMLEEKEN